MSLNIKERTLLWVDSFSEIDRKKKLFLFEMLENATEIKKCIEENKPSLEEMLSKEDIEKVLSKANNQYFESLINGIENLGVKVLTYFSNEYPSSLLELKDFPLILYCKGNLELLKNRKFTVVGSRRSLPLSIELTKTFSTELLGAGFTLVSGIADGVDKTVLETAVDCNKPVISIVAGGIDTALNGTFGTLVKKVCVSGLVVSERPLGVSPKPFYFPIRNRLFAKLSEGVLVVNGNNKSGVKYTAGYAFDYGVKVFAIPYSVGVNSGEICNSLIKNGACLVTDASEILSQYSMQKIKEETIEIELSSEESEILELIKESPKHIEEICVRLNKAIYEVAPILSMLEIKGVIVKVGVNIYGRLAKTEE